MLGDPRDVQIELYRIRQETHAGPVVENVRADVNRDVFEILPNGRIRNERFGRAFVDHGINRTRRQFFRWTHLLPLTLTPLYLTGLRPVAGLVQSTFGDTF